MHHLCTAQLARQPIPHFNATEHRPNRTTWYCCYTYYQTWRISFGARFGLKSGWSSKTKTPEASRSGNGMTGPEMVATLQFFDCFEVIIKLESSLLNSRSLKIRRIKIFDTQILDFSKISEQKSVRDRKVTRCFEEKVARLTLKIAKFVAT